MSKTKTIEMKKVFVAGKEVMVPETLKVGDLRQAEDIPSGRGLVLQRGGKKMVIKDTDKIEVKEKDYFYDIPDYDVGGTA